MDTTKKVLLGISRPPGDRPVDDGPFTIRVEPQIRFRSEVIYLAPNTGDIDDVYTDGLKPEHLIVDRDTVDGWRRIVLKPPTVGVSYYVVRGEVAKGERLRGVVVGVGRGMSTAEAWEREDPPKSDGAAESRLLCERHVVTGYCTDLMVRLNDVVAESGLRLTLRGDTSALDRIDIDDVVVGCESLTAATGSVPARFFASDAPGSKLYLRSPTIQPMGQLRLRVTKYGQPPVTLDIELELRCLGAQAGNVF